MIGQFLLLMPVVLFLWIIEGTSRTMVQRLRVERAALHHPNKEAARDAFRSVTFAQHLRAVLILRNPYSLYPAWLVSTGKQRTQAWKVS